MVANSHALVQRIDVTEQVTAFLNKHVPDADKDITIDLEATPLPSGGSKIEVVVSVVPVSKNAVAL